METAVIGELVGGHRRRRRQVRRSARSGMPPLFGKRWRALMGVTGRCIDRRLVPAMVVQIIGDLIMAYILARFIGALRRDRASSTAPSSASWRGWASSPRSWSGSIFYEQKPPATRSPSTPATMLVGLIVMGAIIGWWHSGRRGADDSRAGRVLRRVYSLSSSVHTLKPASVVMPKLLLMATSVASRPGAIRMRPMRGLLWRASKVYQRPPR